jgi:hypothetical protein
MVDETKMITRQEAKAIAEEASTKVLAQFLRYLDVDQEKLEDIIQLREDLNHARHLRTSGDVIDALEWAVRKRQHERHVAQKVEKYRFYIITGLLSTFGIAVYNLLNPWIKAIWGLFFKTAGGG